MPSTNDSDSASFSLGPRPLWTKKMLSSPSSTVNGRIIFARACTRLKDTTRNFVVGFSGQSVTASIETSITERDLLPIKLQNNYRVGECLDVFPLSDVLLGKPSWASSAIVAVTVTVQVQVAKNRNSSKYSS